MTEQTVTDPPQIPEPETDEQAPADHTNPDPQPVDAVGDDLRKGRENYEKLAREADGRVEYLKAEQAKAQAEADWNRGKAEALGKLMDGMGIPRVSAGTANMKIPDTAIL